MAWRLVIHYGRSDEVRDLPDVQALRDTVMRLRVDPRVTSYTWLRLPDDRPREDCPRCGYRYERPQIHSWPCRCGLTHVTYRCYGCGLEDVAPPKHDGCGDIPYDHEYWNERHARGRRRHRQPSTGEQAYSGAEGSNGSTREHR